MKAGFNRVNSNNSALLNGSRKFNKGTCDTSKVHFGTGILGADLNNTGTRSTSGDQNGTKVKIVGICIWIELFLCMQYFCQRSMQCLTYKTNH